MFLIMFKTRHALPLVGTRILRPRTSRGETAQCPRDIAAEWPVTRHIHGLDSSANQPQQQSMHGCGQFVSSLHPRQQTCPQTFSFPDAQSPRFILKQVTATNTNGSTPVHKFTVFTDKPWPRPRNSQVLVLDNQPFRHGIIAAMVPPVYFPVRIFTISGL